MIRARGAVDMQRSSCLVRVRKNAGQSERAKKKDGKKVEHVRSNRRRRRGGGNCEWRTKFAIFRKSMNEFQKILNEISTQNIINERLNE